MSADLGVGSRVWVGWEPSCQIGIDVSDPRFKTGRISDGPFLPGDPLEDELGRDVSVSVRTWNVDLDDGTGASIPERLLFPIDDGDPSEALDHVPSDAEQAEGVT